MFAQFLLKSLTEKGYLKDQGVDERIILKWTLWN
jgi:hypothetical protein